MIYRYLLNAAGLCGRGLEMEEMSADDLEQNARAAVALLDEDGSMMALNQLEQREGIIRCLRRVTKKASLKTIDEMNALGEGDWQALTLETLKMPGSWNYDELFGRAKDHGALVRIWRKLHVVDGKDIDAIVEKGLPVASEV